MNTLVPFSWGILARKGSDADAQDYFTRLASAGLNLSTPRKAAYTRFVQSLKMTGLWSRLAHIYTYEGAVLNHQKVKLKYTAPATATIGYSGTLADGDCLPSGGFVSDGTTLDYMALGVSIQNLNPLSVGVSHWNGVDVTRTATASFISNINAGPPNVQLASGATADIALFRPTVFAAISGNAVSMATAVNRSGPGLYHARRSSATLLKTAVNGVVLGTNTNTATNTVASNGLRTAIMTSGSGNLTVLYDAIDDGQMSDGDTATYAAIVTRLMQDLGRVVKSASPMEFTFVYGQSLGAGATTSTLSTTQPYTNRMFMGGSTVPDSLGGLTALTEFTIESPSAGYANQVAALQRAAVPGSTARDMLIANGSIGGMSYANLKKGTIYYTQLMSYLTAAVERSVITNTGVVVRPLVFVHGEADQASLTYQADLHQFQIDIQTDSNAITGRSDIIPVINSQVSSFGTGATGVRSSLAMLAEFRANPSTSSLAGPKYFLTYSDGLHLVSSSSRRMGEYYGKTGLARINGAPLPLVVPTTLTRSGAVITISFRNDSVAAHVGNLVLDTSIVANPGNYGFEWIQTGGTPQTISNVALVGNQIQITLTGDPGTPTTQEVSYAGPATGSSASPAGGPTTGPRGNLRDSDATVGIGSGVTLYNWCVHFRDPVT